MLEKTLLRFTESGLRSFDKGILAEATLFFNEVIVTVGYPDFVKFLKIVGYRDLSLLIKNDIIRLILELDTPLCATYRNASNELESDFNFFRHFPRVDPKIIVHDALIRAFGTGIEYSEIIDKISTTRFEEIIHGDPIEFISSLKDKIIQNNFGTKICRNVTSYLEPAVDLPEIFHYRFEQGEYGIIGVSPIKEAVKINIRVNESGRETFHFLPGSFLTLIVDTAYYIQLCNKHNSGMRSTPLGNICAKEFYLDSFSKVNKDVTELNSLMEVAISGIPRLKELINTGDKTFHDILPIICKKEKFSNWAASITDDKLLVEEYINKLKEGTWLDKIPSRIGRFTLFSGAGLLMEPLATGVGLPGISTFGGVALGAVDSFLIDKIASGWRPSLYIDEVNKVV